MYKKIAVILVILATFITTTLRLQRLGIVNPPHLLAQQQISQNTNNNSAITAKTLENDYQIYQTFNNCGPASLSMALSYYGIQVTQTELGKALRPYQNPQGNNDDKSVSFSEMATKAQDYNLIAYYRPNGSIDMIKQFINADMPVITETLLKQTDDIGHYRVVKGYNDNTQEIIQDDSMQGHNKHISYSDFDKLWQPYDYQFLVLVPKDKQSIAENILGKNLDWTTSWKIASQNMQNALIENPGNIFDTFNLSVALYYTGDYQGSVNAYETIQDKLPSRTLWYQIEPIEAYYQLGNYSKVFEITNSILDHGNKAFSELYIIRGNIYKNQGNIEAARSEYQKAVFYNINMKAASDALQSIS